MKKTSNHGIVSGGRPFGNDRQFGPCYWAYFFKINNFNSVEADEWTIRNMKTKLEY